MGMSTWELEALERFADELETFKKNVLAECTHMERGVRSCQKYMLDDSQEALRKGNEVALNVRACIEPTERLLNLIYDIIHDVNTISY